MTLYEALAGFKKTIKYIDGNDLTIETTEKSNFNKVQCIPNKGLNNQGNLYIIYTFGLPDLEKEKLEILKDLLPENIYSYNVEKDLVRKFMKL